MDAGGMRSGAVGVGNGGAGGRGVPGGPAVSWRTWHSEGDEASRRRMIEQIIRLFKFKKQPIAEDRQNWESRLPNFAKKLEEVLYRNAGTKAEYENYETLGQRLSQVAKTFMTPKPTPTDSRGPHAQNYGDAMGNGRGAMFAQQGGAPAAGQVAGGYSQMIPTPGGAAINPRARAMASQASQGIMRSQSMAAQQAQQQQPNGAAGAAIMNGDSQGTQSFGTTPFDGGMAAGASSSGSGGRMVQLNALNATEAQRMNSMPRQVSSDGTPLPPPPSNNMGVEASEDDMRKRQINRQISWLLILRHASQCKYEEGKCPHMKNCHVVRELWEHILKCKDPKCPRKRCLSCRELLTHHQRCTSPRCALCVPVRMNLAETHRREAEKRKQQEMLAAGTQMQGADPPTAANGTQYSGSPGFLFDNEGKPKMVQQNMLQQLQSNAKGAKKVAQRKPTKAQMTEAMMLQKEASQAIQRKEAAAGMGGHQDAYAMQQQQLFHQTATDGGGMKRSASQANNGVGMKRAKVEGAGAQPAYGYASGGGAQPFCPPVKASGMTLMECFTKEQIQKHINCVAQDLPEPKSTLQPKKGVKAEQTKVTACSVCMRGTLTFEPAPMYCVGCGGRIKRNNVYFCAENTQNAQQQIKPTWCTECHKSKDLDFEGQRFPKSSLTKKKNDEDQEEPWVECEKCGNWQHQICALFNGRRNESQNSSEKYVCPSCILQELDQGTRIPTPVHQRHKAMKPASALPESHLSKYLEARLKNSLVREREVRARDQKKLEHEVFGVDINKITLRTVLCTQRKTEVKPAFAEQYCKGEGNFQTSFPYTSKVILLFQEIDGIDVCLFAMYVQEYGDKAGDPNTRRVYLSYLDSVRYFKPDITSYRGDALRTYVYHDILIGYLDYIKQLGYCNVYIWVCPPQEGDDYILYCHPQKQKVPKQSVLRAWYVRMLKSAQEEGIVSSVTNVHETFLSMNPDGTPKCFPTQLPYFEGDYWVGEAENILNVLKEEARGGGKKTSKVARKNPLNPDGYDINAKLMKKLSENLFNWREDFLLVHLRPYCNACGKYGSNEPWYERAIADDNDPNYSVCQSCFTQLDPDAQDDLIEEHLDPLPAIRDADGEMECEIFDTREAFLSLCQGAHYQFDSLRRAKHSSMMLLYHLHNPSAPSFVCTCNVCNENIEPGQGFRCNTCTDFDICSRCFATKGHEHKVERHVNSQQLDRQEQLRREQIMVGRYTQLLHHLVGCNLCEKCTIPQCWKWKQCLAHLKAPNCANPRECKICKGMSRILNLHAMYCKDDNCKIYRCHELKAFIRQQRMLQENRRRQAYYQYRQNQQA